MNKQRRMLIKEAEQLLNKAKNIIDDVLLEEESTFDNNSPEECYKAIHNSK